MKKNQLHGYHHKTRLAHCYALSSHRTSAATHNDSWDSASHSLAFKHCQSTPATAASIILSTPAVIASQQQLGPVCQQPVYAFTALSRSCYESHPASSNKYVEVITLTSNIAIKHTPQPLELQSAMLRSTLFQSQASQQSSPAQRFTAGYCRQLLGPGAAWQ